jgi:hypothetical protein
VTRSTTALDEEPRHRPSVLPPRSTIGGPDGVEGALAAVAFERNRRDGRVQSFEKESQELLAAYAKRSKIVLSVFGVAGLLLMVAFRIGFPPSAPASTEARRRPTPNFE